MTSNLKTKNPAKESPTEPFKRAVGICLRAIAGRSDIEPPRESGVLGSDMSENDERADYLRAMLAPGRNGTWIATPIKIQDSSMMAALAKADCLVVREAFAPAAKAGDRCVILRLARPC